MLDGDLFDKLDELGRRLLHGNKGRRRPPPECVRDTGDGQGRFGAGAAYFRYARLGDAAAVGRAGAGVSRGWCGAHRCACPSCVG